MLPTNDATTTTVGGRERPGSGGGRAGWGGQRSCSGSSSEGDGDGAAAGIAYRSTDDGQPRTALVANYSPTGNVVVKLHSSAARTHTPPGSAADGTHRTLQGRHKKDGDETASPPLRVD